MSEYPNTATVGRLGDHWPPSPVCPVTLSGRGFHIISFAFGWCGFRELKQYLIGDTTFLKRFGNSNLIAGMLVVW
jgi:hypothetical protein